MDVNQNHYVELGVAINSTDEEIKKAYRKLVMRWHPDRHPIGMTKDQSLIKIKKVNEAYRILSNTVMRAEYDSAAGILRGGASSASGFPFGDGSFGFGGRDSCGTGTSARKPHYTSPPKRGDDTTVEILVDMAVAINGGIVSVCDYSVIDCESCGGFGYDYNDRSCGRCSGQGYYNRNDDAFRVSLPSGLVSGSVLVVSGHGKKGSNGGANGDMNIKIKLNPDPQWEVSGLDLIGQIRIPFSTALLGGEVAVTLASGKTVSVAVPERTDSGMKIRLSGCGLHNASERTKGDAYVRVTIVLPSSKRNVSWSAQRAIRELDKI